MSFFMLIVVRKLLMIAYGLLMGFFMIIVVRKPLMIASGLLMGFFMITLAAAVHFKQIFYAGKSSLFNVPSPQQDFTVSVLKNYHLDRDLHFSIIILLITFLLKLFKNFL
jgi:hypothetical protein